jgi:polyisoprenoid-binding protein YceI
VPGDSTLKFTATQQGAAFEGRFERFTASFDLDRANPVAAHIEALIEMDSVDTMYDERDQALRDTDWFDVAHWAEARFVTERIQAVDGGFIADGLLTLRGTTRPVAMAFQLQDLPDGRLRFTGEVPLARLDFGVGQGQWTNTDWVGNNVKVTIDLVLQPALP